MPRPRNMMLSFIFILILQFNMMHAKSIIKRLPGYPGDLPFKLETGYMGIGKNEDVKLFYYFVESTRNPEEDPLIFYVPGGPGASGLMGLTCEFGMFFFYNRYLLNSLFYGYLLKYKFLLTLVA
ncbi:hypothetical protein OSB04_014631 [Centaurea solstitialis]|uniref:Uncharacterized protein n=1 Tax=Centaurea solstitialis TaxID=347529 RepID=A0AA38T8N6_9ASTR|nr:hypothetical protein OSB04_014631 [Centaurea solstitialis]